MANLACLERSIIMTGQNLSHLMRKPTICENKDTDQLCGNCEADQHLCFRYKDSTIPLLQKSKISSFCDSTDQFVSDLLKNHVGFLMTRLICGMTRNKLLHRLVSQLLMHKNYRKVAFYMSNLIAIALLIFKICILESMLVL